MSQKQTIQYLTKVLSDINNERNQIYENFCQVRKELEAEREISEHKARTHEAIYQKQLRELIECRAEIDKLTKASESGRPFN